MKHHCLKSVCIRSYSGPYFPPLGLNKQRYSVSFRIQSECEKIWTRKTPNTGTFHVAHLYGSDYQEFKFHQCCDGVNDTFVVFILLRRKIIEFNEEVT